MTDWASSAATRFVEQERMRAERWAQALQRHQTLVSQGPLLWEGVREALQAQIQTFNQQVGKQVLIAPTNGDKKLAVYAKTEAGLRAMTAEFDSQMYLITCCAQPMEGFADFEERFHLGVNAGFAVSIILPAGTECSAEEAASHMLNGLMGWNHAAA